MFLKELYISGFKSFAKPSTLEFNKKISAIVGPNGSGKSNISDALRFVLGEQRTKQMRSQKMEDIIFSGTATEKARGAAEVKLTLEREEEPDLIVSRKLFRTGESSYQINGKKVRLKDVHSLFSDTGLGKNGYSIVSQGGVENIIGANPMQIREMVEEAAGIAGFKSKREETERRLKETQDNINRINDILEEVKRQLGPLKIKANKTRRYLEINETLRVIDLVSFFQDQTKNIETLKDLQEKLKLSHQALSDLDEQSLKIEDRYSVKKKESRIKQTELEEFREDLNNKKDRQAQKKEERSLILQRVSFNQRESKEIKRKIEELENKIKKSTTDLNQLIQKAESDQKELKDLAERLSQEKETATIYQNNYKFHTQKHLDNQKQILKNQDEIKTLTETLLNSENQLNQIRVQEESLEHQINETYIRERSIKKELTELETEINTTTREYSTLIKEQNSFLRKEEDLKRNLKKKASEIELITNDLNRLKSQIALLNEQKENYTGYQNSVRAVMNHVKKQNIDEVFGPVAELYTTETLYELAVQVALGGRSQNIIVKTEKTAKDLIGYLNTYKKGRATFLPVTSVKEKRTPVNIVNKIRQEKGFVALASDIVETQKELSTVFNSLLSNTVILDSFDNASRFRRKYNKFTIVTLSGELFYPGGAIVGGSVSKEVRSYQTRNSEIQRTQRNKQESEALLLKKQESFKTIKANAEKLERENQYRKERLSELKQNIRLLEEKIKIHKNNLERSLIQRSSLNEKKNEIDFTKLEKKILRTRKQIETIEQSIDLKSLENPEEFHKKILEQNEIVSKLEIEYNLKKQKISHDQEIRKNLEIEIDEDRRSIEKSDEQVKTLESVETEMKENTQTLDLEILKLTEEVEFYKKKVEEYSVQLKSFDNDLAQLESELKDIQHQRNLEVENRSKLERQEERVSLKRQNLNSVIFETYNVNYAMVKEEIDSLKKEKKDLSKEEIEELRAERRSIGNVSTESIDEYIEQKKRHDYLKKHFDDLIKAEKDILETIEKINRSITEELSSKFQILNKKFNSIFTVLFEGGKASLSFTDPKNVLNSGIELIAQPPGKNLKSLNLLSGGEKAMTAISLLLAFIELNPSPFVIIDEIDAALDDSNILRFTNYLKRVSDYNQFIIITHRKTTLMSCDKINGVTMNSNGVSRLCTLQISDFIED